MDTPTIIIAGLSGITVLLILIRLCAFRRPTLQAARSLPNSDVGTCMTIGTREVQEDNVAVSTTKSGTLAILADGMGKAYGGRIAGRVAVDTFLNIFEDYNAFDNPPYFFRKAFNAANREILKALDNGQNGAASVGAAVIIQGTLYYAVAGNVKICVYRKGDLIPVSTGHTIDKLAQERFDSGRISRQTAIALLEDHRLYNYVGQDEFQDIELYDAPVALQAGDIVVLMSDGVYDVLPWQEIEDTLAESKAASTLAFNIIEKINHLPEENKDNASVVVMRAESGAAR